MTDTYYGGGFSPVAPNASSLPYTLRYSIWTVVSVAVMGALAFLGLAGVAMFLSLDITALAFMGFLGAGALAALAAVCRMQAPRAVFYADRMEVPGLFRTSVLHRSNVKGVRVVYVRGGSYSVVVSSSAAEPDISLPRDVVSDSVVAEWLRGAPDPDALDQMADRAAILGDDRYGATEAERSSRLEAMKRVTFVFSAACIVLAVYIGVLARFDPLTLLLAVAPLLAALLIVAASNGLVTWFAPNSAHPMVVAGAAPAVALAVRSAMFVHLVQHPAFDQGMLAWGIMALFLGVIVWRTSLARGWKWLSLAPLTALTACGLGVAADVILDTSPPQLFITSVAGKRVVHHLRSGPTYHIGLSPWSDRPGGDVSIPAALYDRIEDGQLVCVTRRKGALAQSWFTVDLCPSGLGFVPLNSSGDPTDAVWRLPATPEDLAELYPPAARRRGIQGFATLRCVGQTTGVMSDCRVIQESPTGLGFGAATLLLAPRLRARPRAAMDHPDVVAPVTFTIQWFPPQS